MRCLLLVSFIEMNFYYHFSHFLPRFPIVRFFIMSKHRTMGNTTAASLKMNLIKTRRMKEKFQSSVTFLRGWKSRVRKKIHKISFFFYSIDYWSFPVRWTSQLITKITFSTNIMKWVDEIKHFWVFHILCHWQDELNNNKKNIWQWMPPEGNSAKVHLNLQKKYFASPCVGILGRRQQIEVR